MNMRKLLFLSFLLAFIFGPVVFLALAMETAPAVRKAATARPARMPHAPKRF